MELTNREHEVVTNVYGDEMPHNLREIETEELVAVHDRVSKAVQASYEDDDVDSLGIHLPLEEKIVQVLQERLGSGVDPIKGFEEEPSVFRELVVDSLPPFRFSISHLDHPLVF
nr:hypothetical protein [Halalkaliarchaeum desulfuricum]